MVSQEDYDRCLEVSLGGQRWEVKTWDADGFSLVLSNDQPARTYHITGRLVLPDEPDEQPPSTRLGGRV